MKTTKHMTIRQKLNTEKAAGIVCTMPFIVGFLAFMIIPMCISLYYSFCDYNILQPPTFTGWANFKRMFSDATFYQSLVVTFKFAIISVPLRLIFALIVALLLFKSTKMTGVYRALYYLPSIIGGSVAVAILWKRLFAVDGLVNKLLMVFGMKEPVAWLGDTRTAIWTLIILAVWQFGSSMLIFLSAMKQIPPELYEAARVDGASEFRTFWQISLPLLAPGIVTTALFTIVATWNNYFLPLIMLKDADWYPLTIGLNQWKDQASTAGGQAIQNLVITGSLITIIPLVIAFLCLQKYWQSGLAAGAVKE